MDTNRIKGTAGQVAETVKEALGTVTGNDSLALAGTIETAEVTVQTKFGKAKDAAANG